MLRPAFKGATEREPPMEKAVAQYLLKRSKGNIHVHTLGDDIAFALDTYLSCRRQGLPEPKSASVCFSWKTRVERELILKARKDSCGKQFWVNPVRSIEKS